MAGRRGSKDPEITPDLLLRAYSIGLFPMSESAEDPDIYWVQPEIRGIIPLDQFHVSKSLAKRIRQEPFQIRINTAFEAVMRACAEPRPGHPESWINDPILALYGALHERGHAHSVECRVDGKLVGGLYGVSVGAAFFGESMFSRERDASKVALVHLVARLIRGGFRLLDCQFMTEHLRSFGAIEMPREAFKAILGEAVEATADFQRGLGGEDPCALVQANTRTS